MVGCAGWHAPSKWPVQPADHALWRQMRAALPWREGDVACRILMYVFSSTPAQALTNRRGASGPCGRPAVSRLKIRADARAGVGARRRVKCFLIHTASSASGAPEGFDAVELDTPAHLMGALPGAPPRHSLGARRARRARHGARISMLWLRLTRLLRYDPTEVAFSNSGASMPWPFARLWLLQSSLACAPCG